MDAAAASSNLPCSTSSPTLSGRVAPCGHQKRTVVPAGTVVLSAGSEKVPCPAQAHRVRARGRDGELKALGSGADLYVANGEESASHKKLKERRVERTAR